MNDPKLGPDGHPIPEVQGVVDAVIQPISFKDKATAGKVVAKGEALDADGNVIDQSELLALLGAEPK